VPCTEDRQGEMLVATVGLCPVSEIQQCLERDPADLAWLGNGRVEVHCQRLNVEVEGVSVATQGCRAAKNMHFTIQHLGLGETLNRTVGAKQGRGQQTRL
jgi:hypothetical protein